MPETPTPEQRAEAETLRAQIIAAWWSGLPPVTTGDLAEILDRQLAALIAERDTLHAICLRDQEAIGAMNGERLKALADLTAARAAHERLRKSVERFHRTSNGECHYCKVRSDKRPFPHAADCPLPARPAAGAKVMTPHERAMETLNGYFAFDVVRKLRIGPDDRALFDCIQEAIAAAAADARRQAIEECAGIADEHVLVGDIRGCIRDLLPKEG